VTHQSLGEDLTLHGLRVLGFPAASRVAGRYGLPLGMVEEALLDFQARGWAGQPELRRQLGLVPH
jgi:hypothetical protein